MRTELEQTQKLLNLFKKKWGRKITTAQKLLLCIMENQVAMMQWMLERDRVGHRTLSKPPDEGGEPSV